MKCMTIAGCGAAALLVVVGCQGGSGAGAEQTPVHAAGEFDADVLRVASGFKSWPKLTRAPRNAPALCDFAPQYGTTTHFSTSGDGLTHGQKVYHLYAMDSKSYFERTDMHAYRPAKGDPAALAGIKQVLVKDSFRPEPVEGGEAEAVRDKAAALVQGSRMRERPDSTDSAAHDAGEVGYQGDWRVKAGEALGQYVMIDYGAGRAGTDDGWVYATVKPSGEIVQAGMIESCMGCHVKAPHGRLFGLGKQ